MLYSRKEAIKTGHLIYKPRDKQRNTRQTLIEHIRKRIVFNAKETIW